jgi:hypothetical protein
LKISVEFNVNRPTDEDDDGRLDHITVLAKRGISPEEELERLAERRNDLPAVDDMVELVYLDQPGALRPMQFKLDRHKRGDDGGPIAGPVRGAVRRPTWRLLLIRSLPRERGGGKMPDTWLCRDKFFDN